MMTSGSGKEIFYPDSGHVSVMRREVLEFLSPKEGGVYIDGTFGAGGHTRALLDAADCMVYGIDCDPYVEPAAMQCQEKYPKRFTLVRGKFSHMEDLMAAHGIKNVDGILLDLGVSSMQLDTPRRGFSFSHDGPLDMRMNDEVGSSAEELVNTADEEDLAGIIFKYGGERMSRRIAAAIITARAQRPIRRTAELAQIIREATGHYADGINPATRTFQALRIWVNDEVGELQRGLEAAEKMLSPGGRLAVISFHSGEDKVIKEFLQKRSGKNEGFSRYQPLPNVLNTKPTFEIVTRKVVVPSEEEVRSNPRARSAKMRVAERTSAPDWQGGLGC